MGTVLIAILVAVPIAVGMTWYAMRQCRKPTGLAGRLIVWMMNRSHAAVTSWGLQRVEITRRDSILDVGCGGGVTVRRLAKIADLGKVCGVDYAEASVAASQRVNKEAIEAGRVSIQEASVSRLPFPDGEFNVVTAFETHYYWPDHDADMREIARVLKPRGVLLIVAESYSGGRHGSRGRLAMKTVEGAFLTPDDHKDLFTRAGFIDVRIDVDESQGWICVIGRKR